MISFRSICLTLAVTLLLTACGGGGGGSDSDGALSQPGAENGGNSYSGNQSDDGERTVLSPGSYATAGACVPFAGSDNAELKIFFVQLNGVAYFDELVDDAVNNQFKQLAPFSEYYANLGFYKLAIGDGADYSCDATSEGIGGSAFACDNDKINQAIAEQCAVDDIHGVIKVVLAESDRLGSGGEVIYIGVDPAWSDADRALTKLRNTIAHEVAHNFGLADLYGGAFNSAGTPEAGWPASIARKWRNLDAPGCAKWCNDYKPASEYTESVSASCPGFSSEISCLDFNRDADGNCEDADGDGHPDCCSWETQNSDDYFASSCKPVWGSENIGMNCSAGTGCYYGGAYGTSAWRPVKDRADSIMYSPTRADAFDTASADALRDALRCCASSDDSTTSCSAFRSEYATFLQEYQPFKERVGSCGTGPAIN